MTLIMLTILMLYATLKFTKLLKRTNPNVSSFLERAAVSTQEQVNLTEVGMQFAFGVEGYIDKELKDDGRFVKAFARIRGNRDGETYEQMLPYHRCTKSDWDLFAPPTQDSEALFNTYRSSPDRNLFCMDWEELAIWGVQDDLNSY